MYTFKLEVGRKKFQVPSVEAAVQKWRAYREEQLLYTTGGVSVLGNGGTVYKGKTAVARIFFNGRIEQL